MNHWICHDLRVFFHPYPDIPANFNVYDMLNKAHLTLREMQLKIEKYPNYVGSKKSDLEVYINAVVMNLPDAVFVPIFNHIQRNESDWDCGMKLGGFFFFDKFNILKVTFPIVKEVCIGMFKSFEIEVHSGDIGILGEINSTIMQNNLSMTGQICDSSPMTVVLEEIWEKIERG